MRSHNFLTISIQRAKIKQQDLGNEFARLCSGLGCKLRKDKVKAKRRSKNPEAFCWASSKGYHLPWKHYPGPAPPRITTSKLLPEKHLCRTKLLAGTGSQLPHRDHWGYKLTSSLPLSSQDSELPVISFHIMCVQNFSSPIQFCWKRVCLKLFWLTH